MSLARDKINVGILGATGTVGQRFIQLLADHSLFRVTHLGASHRSAGNTYKTAVNWKLATEIPTAQRDLIVSECNPREFTGCSIIFSGLDSEAAGDIETAFMQANYCVFSNAKNHRMDSLVPICVPLVNPDHIDIIQHQRKVFDVQNGFIVTNANCSTTGLVVALKALEDAFGVIECCIVNTMQAISGAGYPGVSSMDIIDNVIPYISGEEEKLECEPQKILSTLNSTRTAFVTNPIKISATCTRVAVIDGHTELVSIKFAQQPAPTVLEIATILAAYRSPYPNCHSSPLHPIIVRSELDRPQPRLDRDAEKGMAITVGRLRVCEVLDVKFVLLSHNTVLGAAGSSILNAEIAVAKGLIG